MAHRAKKGYNYQWRVDLVENLFIINGCYIQILMHTYNYFVIFFIFSLLYFSYAAGTQDKENEREMEESEGKGLALKMHKNIKYHR